MRLRESEKQKTHKNLIVEEEVKEVAKSGVETTPPTTGDFIQDFYLELPSIPEGEELCNSFHSYLYSLYTKRKKCYGPSFRRIAY